MITFANGQAFDTIRILGAKKTYQGMERDTLAISIPASDITLDEAKTIWKDATATSELSIASGDQTSVLLNYSLPVELVVEKLNDVEVVTLKLAQKSALEIAQEQQAADINDTQLALIELAGIISGGDNNG